jgi:hypothetical protein
VDCVVPAMSVSATFSLQSPVKEVVDELGAKHDWVLSPDRADANAPDESNWKMWRPGPGPIHRESLTWIPVTLRVEEKRKSW